jgi:hypothetical protein
VVLASKVIRLEVVPSFIRPDDERRVAVPEINPVPIFQPPIEPVTVEIVEALMVPEMVALVATTAPAVVTLKGAVALLA